MKTFVIIIEILVILALLLQSFIMYQSYKTEKQQYKVVYKGNGIEIRYYPEATVATVTSRSDSYMDSSGDLFRKLANYIFGGNKQEQKIAMTAPVHMEQINDSMSKMSFVMPSKYRLEDLPIPNSSEVEITKLPSGYYATIQFGGYASKTEIQNQKEELEIKLNYLEVQKKDNSHKYLGYNAPYEVVGRRNEVIIPLDSSSVKRLIKD